MRIAPATFLAVIAGKGSTAQQLGVQRHALDFLEDDASASISMSMDQAAIEGIWSGGGGREPTTKSSKSKSAKNSGKAAKSGKSSSNGKAAKSGKSSSLTLCTSYYSNNATSTASYDVISIEGLPDAEVTFEISSTASRATTIQVAMPYSGSDAEADVLDEFVEAISSLLPDDTLQYRRILQIDFSDVLPSCDAGRRRLNGNVVQRRAAGMPPAIHLILPQSAKDLCVSGACRPVLCPLTLPETVTVENPLTDISFAPSNHPLYFGGNANCTISKPESWDEYVEFHFGSDALTFDPPELFYYADPDKDGASNIVEYYGLDPMDISAALAFLEENGSATRQRQLIPIIGTNPMNFDSDGDLLGDGFELISMSLDPLTPNDINEDFDLDGLSSFQEQILNTDPSEADSDGDGVNDGTENDQGSNPNDDRDSEPNEEKVELTLRVGDYSGSHSERYNLIVGTVTHQAPQFGVVSQANYIFAPGEYTFKVQWIATNLGTPDYDYEAYISWGTLPDNIEIEISDPQGILGRHSESSYDFAAGKSGTLNIKLLCEGETGGEPSECGCFETCKECQASNECYWTQDKGQPTGTCKEFAGNPQDREACSCDKCADWYQKEINDREWVNELPQCPCTVESNLLGTSLSPKVDDGVDWSDDWACSENGLNPVQMKYQCKYHKGGPGEPDANACIRASKKVGEFTYGQQCCYSEPTSREYDFLEPGLESSGTPDRSTDWTGDNSHGRLDVDTYEWCCKECPEPGSCARYIGTKEYDENGLQKNPGARSDPRGCKDAAP